MAGNYDYTLDREAVLVVLGFALLLILEFFCRFTLKKGTWKLRLPMAASLVVLLGAFGLMFHSDEIVEQKLRLYNKLFTPTTISFKNGTALAFVMELRYMSVDKPAGYDADAAAAALAALDETQTADSGSGEAGEAGGSGAPEVIEASALPSDALSGERSSFPISSSSWTRPFPIRPYSAIFL